jgi:glycosyltransferase involved in cell wall biosynthesis
MTRASDAPSIGLSATNPCHLYPMAQALDASGIPVTFYSGYPRWRLRSPAPKSLRTHSLRTLITYGLLRFPERMRPAARTLFRWQDRSFDQWVGNHLSRHDFVHAMPGQSLATFHAARGLGVRTVLNHATGPSRDWVAIMQTEYQRVGLDLRSQTVYDEAFFVRESKEYELADFHCAASSLVASQLQADGIAPDRIWVVPYGADPTVFFPGSPRETSYRILFAGQISLRKNLRTLLQALKLLDRADWELICCGAISEEAKPDLAQGAGRTPVRFSGPISQTELAEQMRASSVLVLPSLEEGFGLVVPQALACSTPCIVSESVGAKDLIEVRRNGSTFAARNVQALAEELVYWSEHRTRVPGDYSWRAPASRLLALSRFALEQSVER